MVWEADLRLVVGAIALLVITNLATAENLLESELLKRIQIAKNPNDLSQLQQDLTLLKVARTSCRIELSHSLVPDSCFEAIFWEKKWHLHKDAEKLMRITDQLDLRCQAATKWTSTAHLSAKCRQHVLKLIKIQAYQESSPQTWSAF